MSESGPLVTVGTTAFNSAATIDLAIASIQAQTYTNWHLVVVDDGSTDDTVEIARSFRDPRIEVFADGIRKGVPSRRNEILSRGAGKYLAWMDSDDVSYPRRLELEVAHLESRPDVDLVAAGMMVFRNEGEPIGKRLVSAEHEVICRRPYSGFPIGQPTFMGHLSWFREHRYDIRATRPDDQDLLLRAFRRSRFSGLQEIVTGYRENRIDLRKGMLGRRQWVGAVLRDAWQHSSMPSGLAAVAMQGAKAAADVIAVATGLNYALLRHRAAKATAEELQEWHDVFSRVREVAKTQVRP